MANDFGIKRQKKIVMEAKRKEKIEELEAYIIVCKEKLKECSACLENLKDKEATILENCCCYEAVKKKVAEILKMYEKDRCRESFLQLIKDLEAEGPPRQLELKKGQSKDREKIEKELHGLSLVVLRLKVVFVGLDVNYWQEELKNAQSKLKSNRVFFYNLN